MTETTEIVSDALTQPTTFETWVKEFTGGPNGGQIKYGGTCIRPDILLHNDKTCNLCECNQYCLCSSRKFAKKRSTS